MRIEILRQTSIHGRPARVGDVIDASDADAQVLLNMGKARAVQDPPLSVQITAGPPPSTRKPRTRKG